MLQVGSISILADWYVHVSASGHIFDGIHTSLRICMRSKVCPAATSLLAPGALNGFFGVSLVVDAVCRHSDSLHMALFFSSVFDRLY
jgi:hypothetical protein